MKHYYILLFFCLYSCSTGSRKLDIDLNNVNPVDSFIISPMEEREVQNLFLVGDDSAITFSLQRRHINIYKKNNSKEYKIIDSISIFSQYKDFISLRKLSKDYYALVYRDQKKILFFDGKLKCVDSIIVDFEELGFKYGLANHMDHPVELIGDSLLFISVYPDVPYDVGYYNSTPFLFYNLNTKEIENYKFFTFPKAIVDNNPSTKNPITRVIDNTINVIHPHSDSISTFDLSTKKATHSYLNNNFFTPIDSNIFSKSNDYEMSLMNYWNRSFSNCYVAGYRGRKLIMFHTPIDTLEAVQSLCVLSINKKERDYYIMRNEFYTSICYQIDEKFLYLPLYKQSLNVKKDIKYYIYSLDSFIK